MYEANLGKTKDFKNEEYDEDLAKYIYSPPVEPSRIEEETWGLTCWQKLRFFTKSSCQDIWRHKCQFCLSFCSVFVVVLSILVVISITELGPIIFLRLSEKSVGEYDGIISSRGSFFDNFDDIQTE